MASNGICQVTITGNVTRDAELREAGGSQVCEFTVAVNDRTRESEVAYFFRCALWGRRGESLAQYLTKGTRVCVSGHLAEREYVTRDGGRGVSHDVRVDDLALMGGGGQAAQQQDACAVAADAYDDVPF